MQGLMQDWPLLCHRIIDHAAIQHGDRPVVTHDWKSIAAPEEPCATPPLEHDTLVAAYLLILAMAGPIILRSGDDTPATRCREEASSRPRAPRSTRPWPAPSRSCASR